MVKWIALVLVLVPASAWAGFLSKKADWDEVSQDRKIGYVMGLFDFQTTVYPGKLETFDYYRDVLKCAHDLRLSSGSMVAIIDKGYEELENWDRAPVSIFLEGIRKVCLNSINKMRTERGEEPLEP